MKLERENLRKYTQKQRRESRRKIEEERRIKNKIKEEEEIKRKIRKPLSFLFTVVDRFGLNTKSLNTRSIGYVCC